MGVSHSRVRVRVRGDHGLASVGKSILSWSSKEKEKPRDHVGRQMTVENVVRQNCHDDSIQRS